MQMNELQTRIAVGVGVALLAALALYQGGVIFNIFVLLVSVLISFEFDKLRQDGKMSVLYTGLPLLVAFVPWLAIVLVIIAVMLIFAAQHAEKKYYPWLIITIIYVVIPAVALVWLRSQPDGLRVTFWLILVVVATDTGAYFIGREYGKTLLAPTISPQKTWEGLGGGAFFAAVISFAFTGSFLMVLLALVFAVIAQASDLMESTIKRHFDVKDTGSILPGHGGVMDRVDGLVLTAPVAALMAALGILSW